MRSVCIEIEFKIEWMFDLATKKIVDTLSLKTLYLLIQHKLFFNVFKNN